MQNKNAVKNQLYLLTDGDQTADGYSNDCLCAAVDRFCQSFCDTDANNLLVLELKTLSTKTTLKKPIAFFGFCGIEYGGPKIDAFPHHLIKRQGSFRSKKLCACSRDP